MLSFLAWFLTNCIVAACFPNFFNPSRAVSHVTNFFSSSFEVDGAALSDSFNTAKADGRCLNILATRFLFFSISFDAPFNRCSTTHDNTVFSQAFLRLLAAKESCKALLLEAPTTIHSWNSFKSMPPDPSRSSSWSKCATCSLSVTKSGWINAEVWRSMLANSCWSITLSLSVSNCLKK